MKGAKQVKKSTFIFYRIALHIKKNPRITKFKIRKGRYVYTFKTDKPDVVKRLTEGLDANSIEKV